MIHRKQPEPQDVQEITGRTLAYYEKRAEEFRAGTRDNDVIQNIAALLEPKTRFARLRTLSPFGGAIE